MGSPPPRNKPAFPLRPRLYGGEFGVVLHADGSFEGDPAQVQKMLEILDPRMPTIEKVTMWLLLRELQRGGK